MANEEVEVTIEIHCVQLPDPRWGDRGPLYLGIQKGDDSVETVPVGLKPIVFRPVLRVRKNADGTANFLGPFAHGPRTERFIYLNWLAMEHGAPVQQHGRIKLHLNHITQAQVDRAVASGRPIKVTLPLTSKKGGPVFASIRAGACQWEL